MPRRIKLGHHYYYLVSVDELISGGYRGKNVAVEGTVGDKPLVEFLPMELPSYRATFNMDGIRVEFAGSPCIKVGDRVRVYGRFLGDCIMASAIETEGAMFVTEE